MNLFESVRSVASASGEGPVDWTATAQAAKATTERGDIDLTSEERAGYADDVRDARERIQSVTGVGFELPETIQALNRHHWIDANADTFRRVMAPLEGRVETFPAVGRVLNTGSTTVALAFLARNVLGQYDPVLLAEDDDHALYFVHPNVTRVATSLDVEFERFRRWIAFHELAHAAEFSAAPWLRERLETRLRETVDALADGTVDREAFRDLDVTMTAVEGYAELVMDRAFDDEYRDIRRKVDERRRGRGPFQQLVRRLLGLGMKRRQYERGKEFFEVVADARGVDGAGTVWKSPESLPTEEELESPGLWLQRVDDTDGEPR